MISHWKLSAQLPVSLQKGSVIIRHKLPELIKKVSEAANPALSRSHVSSMTIGESNLSCRHVSMTGGCTCPIYYQGVVRLEKRSVIIRYKLPELIKRVSAAANPALR